MTELNTYGDLKKAIKIISLKQKGEKIGQVAIDTILGAVPGIGAAKTTFDFVKAAFTKPDTKKTNTWLDKLDIDDEMSSIVDDTVENGFLKTIANSIDQESDDKPLESDFNMNAKMVDYLKRTYGGRTITGITENTMKDRFQKLAGIKKEEITDPKLQGVINTQLFKSLGVNDFDPSKFSTTINLVKQNKSLNPAANKVLADVMVAMIKTSDDNLLSKIFQNLKQIEAK